MDVPCQKCIICLKNQQNSWVPRIYEEIKAQKKAVFVTLTYNPKKVPTVIDQETGEMVKTLRLSDVQLVLKRFRERWKRLHNLTTTPWKYFLCGEYGPKTLRPHYHLIFFGLSSYEIKSFRADWAKEYGIVHCKNVNLTHKSIFNVSSYIAKYACKGLFENPYSIPKEIDTGDPLCPHKKVSNIAEKSFRKCSKGLGISYVTNNKDYHLAINFPCNDSEEQSREIVQRCFHSYTFTAKDGTESSFKIPLCRYYKKKFFGEKNLLVDTNLRSLRTLANELRTRQLAEVYPHLSKDQAIIQMAIDEKEANIIKARSIYDKLSKKYSKSKV